jgi:hypothetical protein
VNINEVPFLFTEDKMDLQDTLNMIAKELPEQYRIIIEAERGYAGVHLETPDGEEVEVTDHDLSFLNRINMLITVARDESDKLNA